MNQQSNIHSDVANHFATRVKQVWASEQAMDLYWKSVAPLEFNRTSDAGLLTYRLLTESWSAFLPGSSPGVSDCLRVIYLLADLLDFNLFTQVAANLHPLRHIKYDLGRIQTSIDSAKANYEPASGPFAVKAKLKPENEDPEFNRVLRLIKAASSISKASGSNSYRISPIGSTPAFADAANISGLGMGIDPFISNVHVQSQALSGALPLKMKDGMFWHKDIPYGFTSSSGGEVLAQCLYSRYVGYKVWQHLAKTLTPQTMPFILLRMKSFTVVSTAKLDPLPDHMEMIHDFSAFGEIDTDG